MDIDDIGKIHYMTYTDKGVGLFLYILLTVTFVFIILSTILLFIPSLDKYFHFFNRELGIIYTVGCLSLLASAYQTFEQITLLKCHLRQTYITMGYTMILAPILYRLIINFPEDNKISSWVKKHPRLYIALMIILELIFNGLIAIKPSSILRFETEKGLYFHSCVYSNLGLIISAFQILAKILLFLCVAILLFLEWNIQEIYRDVRALTVVISVDCVLLILCVFLNFVKISNFIIDYAVNEMIVIIFAVTNHTYIFIVRILFIKTNKDKNEEEKLVKALLSLNMMNKNNNNTSITYTNTTINNNYNNININISNCSGVLNMETMTTPIENRTVRKSLSRNSFIYRILDYHYSRTPNSVSSNMIVGQNQPNILNSSDLSVVSLSSQ